MMQGSLEFLNITVLWATRVSMSAGAIGGPSKEGCRALVAGTEISGSYCFGTVCEWRNARQKHDIIYM